MSWNVGDGEHIEIAVEIAGARQAQAELNATAASAERLGLASKTAGAEMEHAGRRGFLMQQSIFTLRRVAYSSTLALAALGAGAVYMGLKFDATMEQNTITMSHLLGSTAAAKREISGLFQLAATTPFDFAGVTSAARQFLAFGFSVQDTNKDLRVIADTASAFGGSTDVINRIVLALGQMRAKGRVMGQELLQLQEVGVPALQILQQELGLTDQQIQNIGTTGIKADAAIPALIKGLQKRYGGLAAEQAKTLQGQLSTLRDYAAQTLGAVMEPLFNTLKKDILPTAIQIATVIQDGFGKGGLMGSLDAITSSKAPQWFKTFYYFLVELILFINGPLRNGLTPIVKLFLAVAFAIIYVLGPTLELLNTIDRFHHVVGALITAFAVYKTAQMIMWFWNLKLITSFRGFAATILTKVVTALVWLYNRLLYGAVLEGEVMVETTALTVAYEAQAVATEETAIAQWQLNAAMYANPITWIILGIILLVAAFVLLYLKVKSFHDFINDHWRLLLVLLTGPIGLAIVILVNHFDDFKRWLTSFFGWVADKAAWVADKIKSIPGWDYAVSAFNTAGGLVSGAENTLAHLADGGTVLQGGLSWVGERGPELMWLPPSATVAPLDRAGSLVGGDGRGFTSHTTLVIDGKVVGEASAKYQLDREARK